MESMFTSNGLSGAMNYTRITLTFSILPPCIRLCASKVLDAKKTWDFERVMRVKNYRPSVQACWRHQQQRALQEWADRWPVQEVTGPGTSGFGLWEFRDNEWGWSSRWWLAAGQVAVDLGTWRSMIRQRAAISGESLTDGVKRSGASLLIIEDGEPLGGAGFFFGQKMDFI